MEYLKIDVFKGVQRIVFNRPHKKNAINRAMYREIADSLKLAASDDNIVMTVLTGEGDFYSSGNDITSYLEEGSFLTPTDDGSTDDNFENHVQSASKTIENFVSSFIDYPKILVAIVNGPAIGIAATTLGLCDLVYASETAYFMTPFTKLGLTAEGCSTVTFPRILGHRKATEMLFFNHKMTASEAKEYNFVNDVVPHSELHSLSTKLLQLASLPPGSLSSVKKLIRGIDREILHSANEAECKELEKRWESEEFLNGIQSFLLKSSSKL